MVSVMPSYHLILCRPLLLLPSVFPRIRVFSNESVLHIRWPKYRRFSFNISLSNEYSGLISFRMDWFDLLAVQRVFSNTTVDFLVLKATWTLTVFPFPLTSVHATSCQLLMLRCSSLHILYSWLQIPVCFPSLWVMVNFVEIQKRRQQWQKYQMHQTFSTSPVQSPGGSVLKCIARWPHFPESALPRRRLKIWGWQTCCRTPLWGNGSLFKGVKKTFSGFFYPEDLTGLLSMKCRSNKCMLKSVLFSDGTA